MSNQKRFLILGILIVLIAGAIIGLEATKVKPEVDDKEQQSAEIPTTSADEVINLKAQKYRRAVELVEPDDFINTDGIKIKDLVGKKVILVDFWTYSCINCIRTLPHIAEWYEKYKDKGLEIVSIHTPEFEFEKVKENVQRAVDKYDIKYPVAQDNSFKTWTAYRNRYWPRKYLIDIDGFIVYDHIGEGAYAETEAKIQELLNERMERLGEEGSIEMDIAEDTQEASEILSPEVYFGSSRNELLVSENPGVAGPHMDANAPENPDANALHLIGSWNIEEEYAENLSTDAEVIFRYGAASIFTVAFADEEVQVEVLRDGIPLTKEIAGEDIFFDKERSYMKISEERLYRIIEDKSGSGDHVVTLTIKKPGVKMFTFTFG